ncbi:MAG: MMPL family transporter [Chloroflexi bacterium]|nr:MMPL family transporter [Chloroflexota bacterium]
MWILGIVAVFGTVFAVGSAWNGAFEIPDSESRNGFDALDENFGGFGSGQSGSIVFTTDAGIDDPTVRTEMEALFATAAAIEGVTVSSPYEGIGAATQVSDDRTVAYASVVLDPDLDFTQTGLIGTDIAEAAPVLDGLRIEIGGQALAEFKPPQSEFVGLSFAVVVLIVAFGSVLAMGLPISVAVAGVSVGIALTTLTSHVLAMPDFATTIGAMIGLGVGIDYALFIVTRYREGLHAGLDPEEATVLALDTAGRAVIFAGITVVISLLGMLLMGIAFISGMGIGAAITVAVTMMASVTLLPALLGFARERVEITPWYALVAAGLISLALLGLGIGQPLLGLAMLVALVLFIVGRWIPGLNRHVPRGAPTPVNQTLAYRWSRLIQAHPWTWLIIGTVALLALAAPILTLRLGFSDEGNYAESTSTRRAYDLLAEGFGPGFNGPLLVTVEVMQPSDGAVLQTLLDAFAETPGVASVAPPFPSNPADPAASAAYLVQVIPTTAPQDQETFDLVKHLRREVVPAAVAGSTLEVNITGNVAVGIDFTSYLSTRIFLFFGAVLALSFLLLMAVFRSVLVPVKAVVMNMLSIAAAYGVVVVIFQWGFLGSLVGVSGGPIEPFIPMMMFAIVFGLSMDYEVFLLSRVREEFDRTGDPVGSVADGLASTARVITAAAAIMVVVFGSFVFEDDRTIKLFGVGLATAILLDASIVRMLLVPATMELLGKGNWWLPGWLDRILPVIHVEGSAPVEAEAAGGD